MNLPLIRNQHQPAVRKLVPQPPVKNPNAPAASFQPAATFIRSAQLEEYELPKSGTRISFDKASKTVTVATPEGETKTIKNAEVKDWLDNKYDPRIAIFQQDDQVGLLAEHIYADGRVDLQSHLPGASESGHGAHPLRMEIAIDGQFRAYTSELGEEYGVPTSVNRVRQAQPDGHGGFSITAPEGVYFLAPHVGLSAIR